MTRDTARTADAEYSWNNWNIKKIPILLPKWTIPLLWQTTKPFSRQARSSSCNAHEMSSHPEANGKIEIFWHRKLCFHAHKGRCNFQNCVSHRSHVVRHINNSTVRYLQCAKFGSNPDHKQPPNKDTVLSWILDIHVKSALTDENFRHHALSHCNDSKSISIIHMERKFVK